MFHRLSCCILSNVFSKSTNFTYSCLCRLMHCSMMLHSTKIRSVQPRYFINLACTFLSIASTASDILLRISWLESHLALIIELFPSSCCNRSRFHSSGSWQSPTCNSSHQTLSLHFVLLWAVVGGFWLLLRGQPWIVPHQGCHTQVTFRPWLRYYLVTYDWKRYVGFADMIM
jgi:hypothetical protein